jgi:hypothetical protein
MGEVTAASVAVGGVIFAVLVWAAWTYVIKPKKVAKKTPATKTKAGSSSRTHKK